MNDSLTSVKPELICLDLIDTLVLRQNSQFTERFVEQLNRSGVENFDVQKVANRIREKYLEYSLGNYSNDADYLRSILLYYVDRSNADKIIPNLQQVLLSHFEPIDYCREFLEYCATKYRLVLASNFIVSWADELLMRFGIAEYFEGNYISSQIRYRKPAKQFYDTIINDYSDILPERMLMIGDSVVNDFHGAKAAGLSALLFNNGLDKSLFYHRSLCKTFDEIKQMI